MSKLDVRNLSVTFATEAGSVSAVRDLSLTLQAGEVLAIVGESGSGKSVAMMSLLGLTRGPNTTIEGQARFGEVDLIAADDDRLRRIRGAEIAMVFQDPMTAMHPVKRVGAQIVEQIQVHEPCSSQVALERAVNLLAEVGIPRPAERAQAYPFELSGGMRQRAMIAMAMACEPSIIIADEPTTALDVTIQAQILERLRELRQSSDVGIILVTHDLAVVAEHADRVAVMYAGELVEEGTVQDIFAAPQHPYTWGLLGSIPRADTPRTPRLRAIPGSPPVPGAALIGCRFRARCPHEFSACEALPPLENRRQDDLNHLDRCWMTPERKDAIRENSAIVAVGGDAATGALGVEVGASRLQDGGSLPPEDSDLVIVDHVEVRYALRGRGKFLRPAPRVHAVNDVSFGLPLGETLGLVGESGCGKSTLARAIAGLVPTTAGSIRFRGHEIAGASDRGLRAVRSELRMVFQDPFASLNPRRRVADIVGAPIRRHVGVRDVGGRVAELLQSVGLDARYSRRYPHELSGGQRQRVGIARAIATDPKAVLLDEPVSALDVSVQAQILNLLADLRDERGLAYLFVAHDLGVVRQIAQRVAVMYLGKIVEVAPTEDLFERPIHPYTSGLLEAIPRPVPEARRRRLKVPTGEPPDPLRTPRGCVFSSRCARATDVCSSDEPPLVDYGSGHLAACHHPLDHGQVLAGAGSEASPTSAG